MRLQQVSLVTCMFADVAVTLRSGRYCPVACDTTLNYATFNDTDSSLSKKARSCQSGLRVTSFYLCLDWYCEFDKSSASYVGEQSEWCDKHAGGALPGYHQLVNHWKTQHGTNITKLRADEAFEWPNLHQVVIPDSSFFERAFTTIETAFQAYDLHLVYGWFMFYFWGAVLSIGVCARLLSFVQRHRIRQKIYQPIASGTSSAYRSTSSVPSSKKSWIKQHISIPAAFGDRCSRPYGWITIPPRIQSLTIIAFVIFNIVMCSCSYVLTDGNIYWPRKSRQLLRFVSDRTGIISLANFPLIWLFGMRNDVLIWMTGWGFGTYNAFHRWTARIATIQAVIHSLGYTVMILDSGGSSAFLDYWTKHYFWNGELATIAMCALLALSFYGIRRAHYDIFLVLHIGFSIGVLWTMYYHVEIFTGGEYSIFIWPCLAIWILDRTLRLGRILAFDRKPFDPKALISFNSDSNLVRLEIDSSNNSLAPRPGAYYYIHVLDDWLYAHQSHPFTLSFLSSDTHLAYDTTPSPMASSSGPQDISAALERGSSESAALLAASSRKSTSKMVFLIRPYDGFTSRLKSHCLLYPKKLRVLVDGPYGHTMPVHTFRNVLFIVGGTGITVPLSHISHLLSSTSHVQKFKIIWAVRELAFVASVLCDFAGLIRDERIEMVVYVTGSDEAKEDVLGEDLEYVSIKSRRPNVRTVVQNAAQDAGEQSLAIVSCGPARMADVARKASVEMLGKGYHGIEYFEESSKW